MRRPLACLTASLALLAAALWFTTPLLAQKGKKPGGGGGETPPAGTEYFIHERGIWRMDADGSNRSVLPNVPRLDTFSDPSHQRHDGERWFAHRVYLPDEALLPDGHPYHEIWATSDTGSPVLLVAEPDIEVLSPAVWTPDDLIVSFIGQRWLFDEMSGDPLGVVEAGLYEVKVAYDGEAVAGSVPGSLALRADLSTELRVDEADFVAGNGNAVTGHSWAPDLSAFTFGVRMRVGNTNVNEIWIVDLDKVNNPHAVPREAVSLFDSGNGIGGPRWSPDGSRIGYTSSIGTYIYNLADKRTKILRRKVSDSWGSPHWSPDGAHVVLSHWDNYSGFDAIYRFTADLGGKTELTDGLVPPDAFFDVELIPLGWRD